MPLKATTPVASSPVNIPTRIDISNKCKPNLDIVLLAKTMTIKNRPEPSQEMQEVLIHAS